MSSSEYGSRQVIFGYLAVSLAFTLAASLIWAINTIFLLRLGGLSIFQVMVVNATFTASQVLFEVPTGVVADTIGRRISVAAGMLVLSLASVLYAFTPALGWGMPGFVFASMLLGLGFTFQTGAIEAWMVDALDATGWEGPKDRVFAWGQICWGIGMFVGSILGGLLGQFDLRMPFLVRAGLLAVAFIVALVFMRDVGFTPRPFRASTFGAETRKIMDAGLRYGWQSRVIRPMLLHSALFGIFFMYGFYAWQPYVLALLGDQDAIWLLGFVQAGSSAAGIIGNLLVAKVMRSGAARRDPARVLEIVTWVSGLLVLGIAAVGLSDPAPGIGPAAIAIALWVVWALVYGLSGPIRMAFINEHIPSSQRATVLSLDAFFLDGGGAVGQPALGWLSDRASIAAAMGVGGLFVLASASMFRLAGRAAAGLRGSEGEGA